LDFLLRGRSSSGVFGCFESSVLSGLVWGKEGVLYAFVCCTSGCIVAELLRLDGVTSEICLWELGLGNEAPIWWIRRTGVVLGAEGEGGEAIMTKVVVTLER
jgi:hypothetical protein